MNITTFTGAVAARRSRTLQAGPVPDERFSSVKTQIRELLSEPGLMSKPVNLIIYCLLKLPISSRNLALSYLCFQQGVWLKKKSSGQSNAQVDESAEIYADIYGNLKPYSGKILFFRASEKLPGAVDDPLAGWGDHIKGDLNLIEACGNHISILEKPTVINLANALKQELENCTGAVSTQARSD